MNPYRCTSCRYTTYTAVFSILFCDKICWIDWIIFYRAFSTALCNLKFFICTFLTMIIPVFFPKPSTSLLPSPPWRDFSSPFLPFLEIIEDLKELAFNNPRKKNVFPSWCKPFQWSGSLPFKTILFSCTLYHFLSCLLKDLVSHIILPYSEIFGLCLSWIFL